MDISIIIPFFNEQNTLERTLTCIKRQKIKAKEVLFIDSGSTDNSKSIIADFSDKNPQLNIKVIHSGKMSPSTSINLGIKNSISDLITYIDCGLLIPENWLESNLNLMIRTKSKIISPSVYTCGKGLIDTSFIAHTYGYNSHSYVLTGSLINKKMIEDIGYLLPNARANYDVDFLAKTKKHGIRRSINPQVELRYYDTEFCSSFLSGVLKISKYSQNAWRVKSDKKPIIYILLIPLLVLSVYLNISIQLIMFYIITRGFVIPFIKSSSKLLLNIPVLLILPFTGLIIDVSRIIGYLHIHKLFNKEYQ